MYLYVEQILNLISKLEIKSDHLSIILCIKFSSLFYCGLDPGMSKYKLACL